jgi:3-oxoadipate CoA-transferase beta subunit
MFVDGPMWRLEGISPTGIRERLTRLPPSVGAMDLAIGAKKVYVMMEHVTKGDVSKIVARCTYPLPGIRCVDRIVTDLAVLDVTRKAMAVVEMFGGLSLDELMQLTGAPLRHASAH